MSLKVLIIDGDPIESLQEAFESQGAEVVSFRSGRAACEYLDEAAVDAIVTDTVLEGIGGRELIQNFLVEFPSLPVFVRTERSNIEEAFEYARIGVRGYVLKKDLEEELVESVLKEAKGRLPAEFESDESLATNLPFSQYVSKNAETAAIFKTAIERVAKTPSTVLITGESGTGKELLARTIHHFSDRSNGKMVAVNCAALPENLIESELFGHEKGAFTGATKRRIGRFEQASGGTFFLDEVGDLSTVVQTKLLRTIQERSIERVGGNALIPVDVRIVAATHRNLKSLVKIGKFREDLFYRLSVINLTLPPLRERPEDIPGLARYFIENFRKNTGRDPIILTPRAERALKRYPWPGNVRELENAIERGVVLALHNRVDLEDLPEEIQRVSEERATTISLKIAKEQFEKEFVLHTLKLNDGNVSSSAKQLSIARKNLQEKIKKYNIDVEFLRQKDK